MFWKLVLKLGWKLVEWFWWLKGQRGKMGVKGPNKNNNKDVAHRKTMPLAAGKNMHGKEVSHDRAKPL